MKQTTAILEGVRESNGQYDGALVKANLSLARAANSRARHGTHGRLVVIASNEKKELKVVVAGDSR